MTSCDVRATMNGSHGEMVLVLHGLLRHSEGASARGRKVEREKGEERGGEEGGRRKGGREGGEDVGRVDGE